MATASPKLDAVVRTLTTAVLALSLIAVVIYLAIVGNTGDRLSGIQAVLVGWAGVVVGFYFGGHVAQNTAALEEMRQMKATDAAEASALRSEAAAPSGAPAAAVEIVNPEPVPVKVDDGGSA